MMRVISIIAIVFSLVLIIGSAIFIMSVSSYRSMASLELISSYSDNSYSSNSYSSGGYGDSLNTYSSPRTSDVENSSYDLYRGKAADGTMAGTLFCMVMLAIIDVFFLLSLLKIKTKTMKILSIIGMALTTLLVFFSFVPISSPSACSFDEVGALYVLFGVISLTFSIIGTIHAFRVKA
ncbi:MAG: hypothetical protein HY064_00210 [Bacteroidetes bacterium]|nr:hypothetical protein [Bacteroidota bacterium]